MNSYTSLPAKERSDMKEKLTVKQISIIGLMAALVFVSSKLEIRIPSILGVTRFHLGNGMCILSGLLMGALPGGLAAGLGSFFFDLVFWGGNPAGWCVTFATKFLMGYFSGLFYHRGTFSHLSRTANIAICGAIGEFAYIVGYTNGGVPYGITWEEQAEIDRKEEELRQSRLNQGAPEEGNGQERRKDSEGFEEPEWDELPF